jgi:hypothetical protein
MSEELPIDDVGWLLAKLTHVLVNEIPNNAFNNYTLLY